MNTTQLAGKARELQGQAREWQENARDKARRAASAADVYVRENTWTSLVIVLAAGCLLGMLLSASRD